MATTIEVKYSQLQLIHPESNYKDLISMDYFISTVSEKSVFEVLDKMEDATNIFMLSKLEKFLLRGAKKPQEDDPDRFRDGRGIRHIDTLEYKDYWRVQLEINFRMQPWAVKFLLCKLPEGMIAWLGGKHDDAVILTFNVNKRNDLEI